ncbi:MAG: DUF488 domain-containing protein [Sphingobacteriales bacterium]
MGTLQIKRIYQPAEKTDGKRILVDRLWPRGVKKEAAQIDVWMKEITPSDALRKWFHSDGDHSKWEEFKAKYVFELKQSPVAVNELLDMISKNEKVTLLYAARDEHQNHALVLLRFIEGLLKQE